MYLAGRARATGDRYRFRSTTRRREGIRRARGRARVRVAGGRPFAYADWRRSRLKGNPLLASVFFPSEQLVRFFGTVLLRVDKSVGEDEGP